MAGTQRDIPYLEGKFETGDIPTQQDFYDLFASFLHYLQVKQVSGTSTSDVMSQKAISDLFTALKDGVPTAGDTLNKLYNLITAMGRPRGGFDASSGSVPAPTGDNEAGDFWRITVAGTIGTMVLKAGDVLIASIDDAAVAADFYAIQGNVDQATDAVLGLLQIQNQAGAEDAATNATVGNIDHTKAITGRGLRWFWDKVKTVAQTITAMWTFADVRLTNQASSSGMYRGLIIDDTGKIVKETNVTYDPITKKMTLKGVNTLNTSYTLVITDSNDDVIAQFRNDKALEIAGSAFLISVGDLITSGNAVILFNANQDEAFILKDKSSNHYITFRTTTASKREIHHQKQELNLGLGFGSISDQKSLVVPVTAGATTTIATIPIPSGSSIELLMIHAMATVNNAGAVRHITCNSHKTFGNNIGGVTTGFNTAITAVYGGGPSTGGFSFVYNDTLDQIEIKFTNETGTGYEYEVNLEYSYIIKALP